MRAADPSTLMTMGGGPAQRLALRFDRRLLLVYGLLLLDVVVIGSTSLQHVWQPANLIDRVLQNHNNTPLEQDISSNPHTPQNQLPVAVKRELGMSCCCGWLALAVMGTLSLLLSYSPSPTASKSDASAATPAAAAAAAAALQQTGLSGAGARRGRAAASHPRDSNACSCCTRIVDEVELQVKLKYLLVAVATFGVFFALNLVVQIHGRFQQSKATITALKTLAAAQPSGSVDPGLCDVRQERDHQLYSHNKRAAEHEGSRGMDLPGAVDALELSTTPSQKPAPAQHQIDARVLRDEDGGAPNPQSPLYFYWRDFFFWVELGRECFFDGEVQLSGVWVLLHIVALVGGRGALCARSLVRFNTK